MGWPRNELRPYCTQYLTGLAFFHCAWQRCPNALSAWEGLADMQKRELVLGACISVGVTLTQPWEVGVIPIS